MESVIQHASGFIFSVKTFRPFWVLPWYSSIWRQFPMSACVATIRYDNKSAAAVGHNALTELLERLPGNCQMPEVYREIERYLTKKKGTGVRSWQVYEEGVEIVIETTREAQPPGKSAEPDAAADGGA
jgi:hypothetical protein